MLSVVLFYQCLVSCGGIFSVPKHHESHYMEEKYTIAFGKNSTVNDTLVNHLNHLNKLAHRLVSKFTKYHIENCTSEELDTLQHEMNSLHYKLEEFHFIEMNQTHNEVSNQTRSLYLDTINTVIMFNEVVTKLI